MNFDYTSHECVILVGGGSSQSDMAHISYRCLLLIGGGGGGGGKA